MSECGRSCVRGPGGPRRTADGGYSRKGNGVTMMDGLGEEDRAVWFEFGQKLRQAHDRCLGERPRLVSNRDGYVLPHAMLFRSAMPSRPCPIRSTIGPRSWSVWCGGDESMKGSRSQRSSKACRRNKKVGRSISARPFSRFSWVSVGLTGGFRSESAD
jgi:hypothetical protein